MPSGQIYEHANKIANLGHGLPLGAMSTGSGGIGNESVETLLKDLQRRFDGKDRDYSDWRLDGAVAKCVEIRFSVASVNEDIGSSYQVNALRDGLLGKRLPTIHFAHVDLA
jgi:hypothetical protein